MNWFEHNLALLKNHYPDLAEKLASHNDKAPYRVEVAESKTPGFATIKIKKDGREMFLHSAYNPQAEAGKWIERIDTEKGKKVIVIGLGFGYHVEMLLEKCNHEKQILVIEPEWPVFRKVLETRDFSKILENKSLLLAVGEDKLTLDRKLSSYFKIGELDKVTVETLASYQRIFPESYRHVKERCVDVFKLVRVEENTILFFSGLWPENIFRNLPDIVKSPGVISLFNKMENRPGIIISAGPSLGKNIHLLKQAKGKAVLICVGTALRALLKENIKPDLVIAIDGSEMNYRHFEGLNIEDVPLLFFPSVYHKILAEYKAPKIVVADGVPITRWVMSYLEDKGALNYGGSVATAAFDLAVKMGCDPIVFVGQDLAYTEGKSHADGTVYEGRLIEEHGKNKMYVEDIYGNQVLTDVSLYSFLHWFEQAIDRQKNNRVFIDATEGGAKIRGTEIMLLQDVISNYMTEEFEPEKIVNSFISEYRHGDIEPLKDALKGALKDFKDIEILAHEGVEYAEELAREYSKYKIDYSEITVLIKRMERIDNKIKKKENNILLDLIMQRVLLAVMKGPLSQAPEGETERQKGLRVAKRTVFLYKGIEGAAELMRGYIEDALNKLKR